MGNMILPILSLVLGVTVTVFAARHYYRRSVEIELTPFIQLQSNVLSHIDTDVKSDLQIQYRGVKVENLQQLQVLIANTGERCITNVIAPLTLTLPQQSKILDVNVLFVSPEGRDVKTTIVEDGNAVQLQFPLLNRDEFFIVKLLVNGAPRRDDLTFSIVAEDLPPNLASRRLTYSQIEPEDAVQVSKFDLPPILAGIVVSAFAACIGTLSYYSDLSGLPEIQVRLLAWINHLPLKSILSTIGYIVTAILGLLGGLLIVTGLFGQIEFPKRRKFRLPQEFATVSADPIIHLLQQNRASYQVNHESESQRSR